MNRRKRREILENDRKMDEEWEEDDRVAAKALKSLYDFSEFEADQLLKIERKLGGYGLVRAVRRAFTEIGPAYGGVLKNLEGKIAEYEDHLESAFKSPVVQRVMQDRLDYDMIKGALKDAGVTHRDDDGTFLPGGLSLEHATIMLCHKLDAYAGEGMSPLRRMAKEFREMYARGGHTAARLYAKSVVDEMIAGHTVSMTPFLSAAVETIGTVAVREPQGLMPALDRLEAFKEAYVRLGEDGAEVLGLLGERAPPELAQAVSSKMEGLHQAHAKIPVLTRLLRGAPQEVRFELFETVSQQPVVLELYQAVKPFVGEGEFAEFLLGPSALRIGGRPMLELAAAAACRPSQREAAAFLVRHAAKVAQDSRAHELAALAHDYAPAHLTFKDYFEAESVGVPSRAALALAIAEERPSQVRLKALREKLRGLTEEEAERVLAAPASLREKALMRQAPPKTIPARERELDAESWEDAAYRDLSASGAAVRPVQEAYRRLAPDYVHRLRNIWRTRPEGLQAFAGHAAEFGTVSGFRHILDSPLLFNAYKARLGEEGFYPALREAVMNGKGNTYSRVAKLLLSDGTPPASDPPVTADALLDRPCQYGRLVIWGGGYSAAAKARIRSMGPVEVEIFDMFSRRRDLAALRQTDAVIWVTSDNIHDMYGSVKRHCKALGIGFYHFNRPGMTSLVEFLQELPAR